MSRAALEKAELRAKQQQTLKQFNLNTVTTAPPAPQFMPPPIQPSISHPYQHEHHVSQVQPYIMSGIMPPPPTYVPPSTPSIVMPLPHPIPYPQGYVHPGFPIQPSTGNEETVVDPSNILPFQGNSSFNINNLLYNNITGNDYFNALYQLNSFHEVLNEVYARVEHVEPWQTGTQRFPSSAFCLLLKLMQLKVTINQMHSLLKTNDCAFIRAIGFLYLRYVLPPKNIYKWFEPYLEDEEVIHPCCDKSISTTIGEYCIKLLTDMQYYGTTLPRIPVPIERKIKVMLLLVDEKKKRRKKNFVLRKEGKFEVGSKVRAIYSDEENEPAWYDAVIDSIDEEVENKFWVTFTDYGNSECVDLGDMDLLKNNRDGHRKERSSSNDRSRDREKGKYSNRSRSRSRSRDRDRDSPRYRNKGDSRSRSRSTDRNVGRGVSSEKDLLERVLQSQREASQAKGKNYGQRPASYKGSLSLKVDRFTARKRSPSRDRDRYRDRDRDRDRERDRIRDRDRDRDKDEPKISDHRARELALEKQRKMKLLKDKYGDASTH